MKFQLKLQSFFFLAITVALVTLTVFLGRVVYSDLYRKILLTFDQKLLAASTVVAAFVSGEDHKKIEQVTQLRGIAVDRGQVYARYAVDTGLAIINPAARFTRKIPLEPEPLYTMDITAADGMIYAALPEPVDPDAEEPQYSILYIDPRTGATGEFAQIGDACIAIAYLNKALYCAGASLTRIPLTDGKAGEPEEVAVLDTIITGLGASADGSHLLATDTNSQQILLLNPSDGSVQKEVKLREPGRDSVYPFGLFSIVYDPIRRAYLGVSTTAMVEIDLETGEVKELSGVAFGPPEAQQTYRQLVDPMIRARKGTELHFLYSAILVDRETTINYALDSTQSDIHSNVGIAEIDQAEDDIRDVILKREIYLSDIVPWEDWGLLKSSYVPILNDQGDAVAYAGADVNIDIIESRTRLALLQVVIIGVVALAGGLLIAYFITQRLTQPIHELKQSALQVAAGGFGNEIHVENPAELTRLSGSLTRLSRSLQETVTSLTGENFRLEEKRRRNELINLIHSFMKHKSQVDFFDVSRRSEYGIYEDSAYLALWIQKTEDPLSAARISSDIYRISRRLLQQRPGEFMSVMRPFVGRDLDLILLLHRNTGELELQSSESLDIYPVQEKSSQRMEFNSGEHKLAVKGLQALYLVFETEPKDRSAGLQGKPRPRISEWKKEARSDSRYLEIIL
ncbi:MAG: hypothetical protein CMN76_18010 [Spirochaetaceae bacterium]|nr:hypothetical protein [Spirochaetaceae bacterium]|tara:strand:- start:166708 stop:168756 length:2049 start_codon:yes stop_codon:yes gene_type:complete